MKSQKTLGRPTSSLFRVFDIETGELLVEGTSAQCAEKIGAPRAAIRSVCDNYVRPIYKGRYEIERVQEGSRRAKGNAETIRQWNEFTEPLRKAFGIQRYSEKTNGEAG